MQRSNSLTNFSKNNAYTIAPAVFLRPGTMEFKLPVSLSFIHAIGKVNSNRNFSFSFSYYIENEFGTSIFVSRFPITSYKLEWKWKLEVGIPFLMQKENRKRKRNLEFRFPMAWVNEKLNWKFQFHLLQENGGHYKIHALRVFVTFNILEPVHVH